MAEALTVVTDPDVSDATHALQTAQQSRVLASSVVVDERRASGSAYRIPLLPT